jgi:hypothetical protein
MQSPKSPKPSADEVLHGWHIVREGKAKLGDKYWVYRTRSWLPVLDKHSFLGSKVEGSLIVIIRKGE